MSQTNLFDEIIVDNFAGGGGASTGIELAAGRPVAIAINAQGFPIDYIIETDYLGNAYPRDAQVARCGNAVCPPLAEAMVRANLPEWCSVKITTMAQLDDAVAV